MGATEPAAGLTKGITDMQSAIKEMHKKNKGGGGASQQRGGTSSA